MYSNLAVLKVIPFTVDTNVLILFSVVVLFFPPIRKFPRLSKNTCAPYLYVKKYQNATLATLYR